MQNGAESAARPICCLSLLSIAWEGSIVLQPHAAGSARQAPGGDDHGWKPAE
jgi:hypothetical protein